MKPTCLLYLDGQLDAQRAAELSAHAAVCGDCRALLGALEKESRLLGQALLEQDEPLPIRLRASAVRRCRRQPLGRTGRGRFRLAWPRRRGLCCGPPSCSPGRNNSIKWDFKASSLLSTAVFQRRFLGRMGIHV